MKQVVVEASGLSKTYRVYQRPWDRLVEALLRRPRHKEFRSLQDIDLQLAAGDSLGIIGENGAGKSTLLKILAGVAAPTNGDVQVQGKVASILELASGFHPEFTGRQNIQLNAAMLGLSQKEVEAKTPNIIAFSELGDFIDQPVKVYSTGMAMRLGFAIATQVEPDVLIIDEALSVGDGYFQKKCVDRLMEFTRGGGTLLFCSHAMYYVTSFCQRALWLKDGKIAALGPVEEVVRRYENFLMRKQPQDPVEVAERPAGPARIVEARLLDDGQAGGTAPVLYRHLQPLSLEVSWETTEPQRAFHLGVGIDRTDSVQVAALSTYHDGLEPFRGRHRYSVRLDIPQLPMLKGEYSLYVFLMDEEALHPYDSKVVHGAFEVATEGYRFGLIHIPHRWQTEESSGSVVTLSAPVEAPSAETAAFEAGSLEAGGAALSASSRSRW
ncbi:MAG: ABC transporter ATP-binding protein [Acidobacteriota bacterium]|nr:ABC transporter ATP-binding protein [Acidobacteriota bacterium]